MNKLRPGLGRAGASLLLAAALALAPGLSSAQTVSDADARAMREVIEAQLEAFRRDDAPRSVSFEAPVQAGDEVVQPVRMTDASGSAWVALYPMVKQPDGTWRINGCQLGRPPARET
jgi:hypothetical protein